MKDKGKMAARVNSSPSRDPRKPRKARRKEADAPNLTAENRVMTAIVVEDSDGRWALAGRVVDTVDLLHRRRMIDDRQRMAGATYQSAVEAVGGSMGSALDMTRIRRAASSGTPLPGALWGARVLTQAASVLGTYLGRIVASVLVEGRSIEQTAHWMAGGKASQRDVEFIGRTFREALTSLADVWHPVVRGRMTSDAAEDARPSGTAGGAIEGDTVAHATSEKIFYSRKP